MTESSSANSPHFGGPWTVEASTGKAIDISGLPGDRERRTYVGYVYVVALGDDLVKVGRTTNPRSRLNDYVGESQVSGHPVKLVWLSAGHLNFAENERALIDFGRRHCKTVVRSEYFRGLPFQHFVEFASSLAFAGPTAEALAALEAETRRGTEALKAVLFPGFAEQARRGGPPATMQDVIGSLFGRFPDGSYNLPATPRGDDDSEVARAEIARALQAPASSAIEALDRNWIDERAEIVRRLVDVEVWRLETFAHGTGLRHIEETYLERGERLGVLVEVEDDGGEEGEFGTLDPKVIRP